MHTCSVCLCVCVCKFEGKTTGDLYYRFKNILQSSFEVNCYKSFCTDFFGGIEFGRITVLISVF